ncbi:Uncharacterised protein [Mycobacterium tuberculosis]|uniref:Uncharacterized protein n=1 Tax=Mycobacterium tuberculosis TaxID=1773 RepID=A0A654TN48_MYCTX|nr:Uncharacterised protein [Mycobacterium tuberculosis]CFR67137.1 Uncharacterised protein [Mycobacterium tuberculosis]CFR83383.1 Uncharacterised protein [Mycobacterium tuberculosis]CNU41910.1 Uncharacterised protein [Mycobacterium tuberculosis]CNV19917.1 Uncharacterised protein [Mycobacterium tuberculosis]
MAGVDHPGTLNQRHSGQPARQHPYLVTVVDRERPQVHVAGRQRAFDPGRHGRQFHHRLRDPAAGIVADLLANGRQFGLRGFRAEHDAVTTGSLDRLEDQFADPVQHLFAFVIQPASEGFHVRQQRLFVEVVLDHGRHVRVDEFVVTDSVADRTGQHDVAGPGSVDQSGHPEHRIGTELQRIQEGVINAPIDDVDLALPLGGAHVYLVVSTEQVAALDQFDTHLPGQQ